MLRRVERLGDVRTNQLLADALDDRLDDLEVDVGLEQRKPDLLECRVDRLLIEPAPALDPVKRRLQLAAERVKHVRTSDFTVGALIGERSAGLGRSVR